MEKLEKTLEIAISIAKEYHSGQVDKNGEDYILHPLRVMEQMQTTEGKIVAVLHDVIEDTECSKDILLQLIGSKRIIEVVELLSRGEGENYFDYVMKLKPDPIAKAVKIADLRDNLGRPGAPESLRKRYHKALQMLEE